MASDWAEPRSLGRSRTTITASIPPGRPLTSASRASWRRSNGGPPLTSDRPGAPGEGGQRVRVAAQLAGGASRGGRGRERPQIGGLSHDRELAQPCPGRAVAADHELDVALHLLGQRAERDDRDPIAEQQVVDQRGKDLGREFALPVQLALEILSAGAGVGEVAGEALLQLLRRVLRPRCRPSRPRSGSRSPAPGRRRPARRRGSAPNTPSAS